MASLPHAGAQGCQSCLERFLDTLGVCRGKLVLVGKRSLGPERGLVIVGEAVELGEEPVA
jgi:hypothetical protein